MGKTHANIPNPSGKPPKGRGTSLVSEHGFGHHDQPSGKSIGIGPGQKTGHAEHHRGQFGGAPHKFRGAGEALVHNGGYRIGGKKK